MELPTPILDAAALDRALARPGPGGVEGVKGGRTVSVCIPARNESTTVGAVVAAVRRAHLRPGGGSGLVDEVVVVDDGSEDATGERAGEAGATVVRREAPPGKGRAMAAAAESCHGDLVVFLDADVIDLDPRFVSRLVGALLVHPELQLVKGLYRRPLGDRPSGGGRVTELVARPLLQLLFPELSGVRQPLAGETALRRPLLDKLVLEPGYGVELGLLIDAWRACGPGAIGQVDLGVRVHRNRSLEELRPQATDVLAAALARAGDDTAS